MRRALSQVLLLVVLASCTKPPSRSALLAERLGYPRDARLLIVHADDLGLAPSINAAAAAAFETGLVNSGSVMAPCPAFAEMADYARRHPAVDLGLHLTLTAERPFLRYGPVSARELVPTLLDSEGALLREWPSGKRIDPAQVEIELRAQIGKALAAGMRPTHLDSHQTRLYKSGRELFAVLVRLGHEYRIPILVGRNWFSQFPYLQEALGPGDLVIDHVIQIGEDTPIERWAQFYTDAIVASGPGITEILIHPGYDDEDLRAKMADRREWGAAWRQRDTDFFTSERFRTLLREHNIKLVTWRELARAGAAL